MFRDVFYVSQAWSGEGWESYGFIRKMQAFEDCSYVGPHSMDRIGHKEDDDGNNQ
jgi:hypothetical protein